MGPAIAPCSSRWRPQPLAQVAPGVCRRGDERAQDDVGVPGEVLGDRVQDHVGAAGQRLLHQGSGEGVVTHRQHAALASRSAQRRQVEDLEHRVGRRLDPEHRGTVQDVGHRTLVTGIQSPHPHRAGLLELVEQGGRAVVGVRRHHHGAAVGHEADRRCDRRHPRGEDEGLTALHRPERLLEGRPRRVPRPRVVDRPVGDVGRGELEGGVDPGAGQPVLATEGNEAGGGGEGLVDHRARLGGPSAPRRGHRSVGDTLSGDDLASQTPPARPASPSSSGAAPPSTRCRASTAAGVMRAIDRDAYEVIPIGIARDGQWVLMDGDPAHLELTAGRTPEVRADRGGRGRCRSAAPSAP